MKTHEFWGAISAREEFFYPDTACAPLPSRLRIALPQNGRPGIQLLMRTEAAWLPLSLESGSFRAERFCLRPVPVEYNTGDGREQGGAMVLEKRPARAPAYATRLAPFFVYDCLEPLPDGRVPVQNGLAAAYVCLVPAADLAPGEHTALLRLGEYVCRLELCVYDVRIPAEEFPVTNWFSLDAICRSHQVKKGTPAFYEMVRRYARCMRRMHQTMFYLELDSECVVQKDPYRFDFSYLRPLIDAFFAEGMSTLELGALLSRGFLPDGSPDMYTDRFTCAMAPDLPLETPEGYALTVTFVRELAAFLRRYGWQDRVVFHIHDEPDIHCRDRHTLDARRRQYYLAAGILRRELPGVRVIEAVATPEFRGGVDLWVPGTAGYEEHKTEFDRLAALGEPVWTYVCCGPEGHWLNRFLDFALLKGRLLFWGCAKNRLSGFLHWGFNQFPPGMDPFSGTSCPNPTGIGTNFPCGDAFLVYPGPDGPWPGMRLEAARRGAEDAALLRLLRLRDEAAHDELVTRIFHSNTDYEEDPQTFEIVWEELLRRLAAGGEKPQNERRQP